MSIEIKKIPERSGEELTLPMHGLMEACGGIVKRFRIRRGKLALQRESE
jgi:hypothetical protein